MLHSHQSRVRAVLEILVLTALGVLGNAAKVTLFLNVDLIFGSAFAMVILLRHGLLAGAVSGTVIASYTYLLWNHPYAIIIFGAEVLIVGLLERRSNDVGIVLFDLLYWVVIGMPLVFLFYHVAMRLDQPGTIVIMLKQATNGVFNATLGVGIAVGLRQIELLRRRRHAVPAPLLSTRTALTTFMITLSLVPPTIMVTMTSRSAVATSKQHIVSEMEETVAGIEHLISSWVAKKDIDEPLEPSDDRQALIEMVAHLNAASRSSVMLTGPGETIPVGTGPTDMPAPNSVEFERRALSSQVDLLVPPAPPNVTVMQRWAGTVAVTTREISSAPGWQMEVRTDFGTYQADLHSRLLVNLGILALLVLTGVVASSLFGFSLARRTARLAELTRNLPQRIATNEPITWPASPLQEIAILVENFKAMHASLSEQFTSLVEAREAADAANRAKSQFLANISHEIRTPMHSVLGLVRLAQDPATDPQQRSAYLSEVEQSGKMLVGLLDDILDLSRIEAGVLTLKPSPIDVRAAIADVVHAFGSTARQRGIALAQEIDPDLPEAVVADGVRLRQVLLNLVGNAVKFTEHGSITVHARFAGRTDEDGTLTLAVSDTGVGIPEEEQQRIFEPFTQQHDHDDRRYGGSGLGLAITTRLVSAMDGSLAVTSEVGVGSTFTVEIPVAVGTDDREPEPVRGGGGDDSVRVLDGLRLLVAEDDRISMVVAREYITRAGGTIVEAANGEDAVRAAGEQQPDVVLLDVQMPVVDGVEAARRLRADAATQGLPLIAMTAGALEHRRDELDALFDAVIQKPYEREELLETVAAVMQTRR